MPSGPAWADLIPHAQALWANEAIRPGLLLLGVAALIYFMPTGGKRDTHLSQQRASDVDVKRPTNTALWLHLWWRVRPPHDLMRVDGLAIDRTRKPHCAWLGPTGAGKSQAVATLRCDGARVYLAATPDLSDPLIAATARRDGFRWTAGVSKAPINFFPSQDTPNDVAEFLTEVFRSGGTGAWKRRAYVAIVEVVRALDAASVPRTFLTIGRGLEHAIKTDRELRLVCEGWVARFLSVAEKLGESAGPNGVDVADLLRRGVSVLIDNDAFLHPGLCEDVVALALALGMRCAHRVPGGFRLIFEEAGQLGDRIDLAAPFFRAGRRRKIMVDVLTQAESDLEYHGNDAITANVATRVYFAQELKSLQKVAADRLGLDYHDLDPANMRDFTAYIAHGRIRRLVHFPKPPKPIHTIYEILSTHLTPEGSTRRRYVVREIGPPDAPGPALPLPELDVQEVLAKIDRSHGDCWLWTGSVDRNGYAVQFWAYPDPDKPKNNRPAHQVVWEIMNGRWFPVGEWDHRRTCERRCVNPYHGEPGVSKPRNVRRMHRIHGHATNVAD
jgi:hypothetical protein